MSVTDVFEPSCGYKVSWLFASISFLAYTCSGILTSLRFVRPIKKKCQQKSTGLSGEDFDFAYILRTDKHYKMTEHVNFGKIEKTYFGSLRLQNNKNWKKSISIN